MEYIVAIYNGFAQARINIIKAKEDELRMIPFENI